MRSYLDSTSGVAIALGLYQVSISVSKMLLFISARMIPGVHQAQVIARKSIVNGVGVAAMIKLMLSETAGKRVPEWQVHAFTLIHCSSLPKSTEYHQLRFRL